MRRPLLHFTLVLLVAASTGCHRPAAVTATATPAAARDDGPSIFALDVGLVDQDGRRIQLHDLGGHPLVVTMMYASCTSICPRIVEDMKAVERAIATRGTDVRFVLFSLDAERDTPGALRRFADAHHLDPARWRLLSASADGVRDLAAVLDVRYAPTDAGEIAHSALIAVLDRNGVVRHRQRGAGAGVGAIADAVDKIAAQ